TRTGFLGEFANSAGAALAGVLPHRAAGARAISKTGLDAHRMFGDPRRAYIMLGMEPELDCWDGNLALRSLRGAKFTICLTAYQTEVMKSYAHVLLPMSLFAETSGTYINNEGRSQSFNAAVPPPGEVRPAWKILRVLGNLFRLPGFDYNTSLEVRNDVESMIRVVKPDNNVAWKMPAAVTGNGAALQRIATVPMNAIDPVTRRAQALQQTTDVADGAAHVNSALAGKLGLEEGRAVAIEQEKNSAVLPVVIDDRVPDQCVLIHAAQPCHAELGPAVGAIKLRKP
ncbi:MAG: molybdopterin-dependent oxidoreductase, partial [Gammaproteobacteria bacterium]